MDSFVSLYPIFRALVLSPFMCLAFVGLRTDVCCIIGHISKPLVVAMPGLQHAQALSKYKFLLLIHMLGSVCWASWKLSSVLPICDEDRNSAES